MRIRDKAKDAIVSRTPRRHAGGALIKRDPTEIWSDMDRLFDDFRSAFDDLFWVPAGAQTTRHMQYPKQPLMNIEDTGKEFILTLETPGIKKEDVNIEVSETTLEISAESKTEEEEKDRNYLRRERSISRYYRCMDLPEEVKTEDIDAKLERGILKITLPKKEPKEIEKKKVKVT
jgi:HSP20 family protein